MTDGLTGASPPAALASARWRARRLRRRADFLRVQAEARRVSTEHFTLLVAAQPPAPASASGAPARLGLVVTRKLGGATVRNRIKRLCRECFRLWPDLLPPRIDLVVVARKGAHLLRLGQVRAEWARAELRLRKYAEEALARPPGEHHLSPRKRP